MPLYVERRKYTAMLHTSIGIGTGYWYRQWPILLDIGLLSWYRSNPSLRDKVVIRVMVVVSIRAGEYDHFYTHFDDPQTVMQTQTVDERVIN